FESVSERTIAATTDDLPVWRGALMRICRAVLAKRSRCHGSGSMPAARMRASGVLATARRRVAFRSSIRWRSFSFAGSGQFRQPGGNGCVKVVDIDVQVRRRVQAEELAARL